MNCSFCDIECTLINYSYTCRNCGLTNNTPIYDNPELEEVKFMYTRNNHLLFKLNKLNATDNDKIPDNVIERLKKCEFNNIFELRKVMKKYKYGYYYKNIHYIWLLIKGSPIMTIDPETKDKIIQYFDLIQMNYFNCEENRIQFINYNYFIFKICCLLSKYEYAKHIPFITRHPKTIYSYDKTFKAICNKLNWKFTDTYSQLELIENIF